MKIGVPKLNSYFSFVWFVNVKYLIHFYYPALSTMNQQNFVFLHPLASELELPFQENSFIGPSFIIFSFFVSFFTLFLLNNQAYSAVKAVINWKFGYCLFLCNYLDAWCSNYKLWIIYVLRKSSSETKKAESHVFEPLIHSILVMIHTIPVNFK